MLRRIGITLPLVRVWLLAITVGVYSCLSLLKSHPPFAYIPDIPLGLDAVLSFAMALLIAFRMNRAYERWWEARTLWGSLVNASRNFAIKCRELLSLEFEERQSLKQLIISFSLGLKDHLHDGAELNRLPGLINDNSSPKHVPSYIVRKLYGLIHQWHISRRITDSQQWVLDRELRRFIDICGGCERIKATLMPISWRFVTWQCISIYLLILPWGLVDDFGIWVIPLAILTSYLVISAEMIAHYVEVPFDVKDDHLDIDSIHHTIDRSISEILLDEA